MRLSDIGEYLNYHAHRLPVDGLLETAMKSVCGMPQSLPPDLVKKALVLLGEVKMEAKEE